MIYLVNPSEKNKLETAGDRMPLGLLSIATELNRRGRKTRVFDLNHTSENIMYSLALSEKPEAIGISVYTSPSLNESKRLANIYRGFSKVIAGGHHANALPYTLTSNFDGVVIGEGENSILRAIREGGIINEPTQNLRRLNPINFDLINTDNYGINLDGKRTATVFSSRGCPYECAFCGNIEDKVRSIPTDNIKNELNQLRGRGFESFYFVDDVFAISKRRMKKVSELMREPFRVTTRANTLNDDKMNILEKNGCSWISLGIESGNDEILKYANKRMTTQDNLDAVKLANKYGIKTKGFFIIGMPFETRETAKQTIDFSKRLKDEGLTSADFYFMVPFPGTPIWKNPKRFGIKINDRNFNHYLQAGKEAKCVIETDDLKSRDIEELVMEAKEQWKN